MLKGFKDFVLRGDVIQIAVGLAIGAAFTAVVKAFTDNFVNPLIASIGPDEQILGFGIQLGDCPVDAGCPKTFIDFGAIISAGITFLLTAFVIYFLIVVPYNKARELIGGQSEEDKEVAVEEQILLLREIRDSLSTGRESRAGDTPAV